MKSKPLFCPNVLCTRHKMTGEELDSGSWYVSRGSYTTAAFGRVPRYRCLTCNRSFSDQTFSPHYYAKCLVNLPLLLSLLSGCMGVRAMGRALHHSPLTILNRIERLARQAIALDAVLLPEVRLKEDLVADGFESFIASQYWPTHITLAAGAESRFLYFHDPVVLRRKGRMTEEQRARRATLEQFYLPDPHGVFGSFTELLAECFVEETVQGVRSGVLRSDMHRSYAGAVAEVRDRFQKERGRTLSLVHKRYSSRLPRTRGNPLFAVNYFDRELRKDLSEHVRETTRWGCNLNDQNGRLWIYRVWHNYRKTFLINSHRENQSVTHAQVAGIAACRIHTVWQEMFSRRAFLSRIPVLPGRIFLQWARRLATPLRVESRYYPRFAWG